MRSLVLTMLAATILVGCEPLRGSAKLAIHSVQHDLERLGIIATTGPSEVPGGTKEQPYEYVSPQARMAKANTELLYEMIQVVLMRKPKSAAEFSDYLNALNQGASLEGIYNGLTHSSAYRALEIQFRSASPNALKAFGEELAVLELDLPVLTEFTEASAQPLSLPVQPTGGVDVVDFPAASVATPRPSPSTSQAKPSAEVLSDRYSKVFVGASIFTLKRVLADEAIKVITAKKIDRVILARWYSTWVVHMQARNINFGLDLRNKADVEFHNHWALTATQDKLEWEVLNRLHRVMNELNQRTQ